MISRIVFESNLKFVEIDLSQVQERAGNIKILISQYARTGKWNELKNLIQNRANIFSGTAGKWNQLCRSAQNTELDPKGQLQGRVTALSNAINHSHSNMHSTFVTALQTHENLLINAGLNPHQEIANLSGIREKIINDLKAPEQIAPPPYNALAPAPSIDSPDEFLKAQTWLSEIESLYETSRQISNAIAANTTLINAYTQSKNWGELANRIEIHVKGILSRLINPANSWAELNQTLNTMPQQLQNDPLISARLLQHHSALKSMSQQINQLVTNLYENHRGHLSASETSLKSTLQSHLQKITTALSGQQANPPDYERKVS